ncbi:hypothetical protein HIM_11971 [Hirsutella minnesotensis 3608]|uniref:F-box domain-containing protein n=1 Tax=Hirsutella minnesotensis 3608 TaxID=1043627 RepID=A0A0F7ZF73_9HYPO|nr:hypothetical protein HIM_11971 [Hirsutella minnesotensis 3608]
MGQTFKLLAPHARLAQEYGGKLGEILFDGSAKALVKLLAVPVRHTIDLKQAPIEPRAASHGGRSPASEVTATVAVKRKADAETSKSPPRLRKKTNCGSHAPNSQPATFSGLPTELHQLIFFHIEYIEDVVSLGLVNQRLCDIAREELRTYFCEHFGPWAHQKIVCVGEYAEPNDYPPGLFSDAELEALSKEQIEVYDEGTEQYIVMTPSTLNHFTLPGVSRMQQEPSIFQESFRLRDYFSDLPASEDAALISIGLPPWTNEGREYFPTNQPWILRNLTTKQFVRAEAIALKPEFIHGPNIEVLGFGEVILSRICWSSSAAWGIADPTNICRGRWAAHCFDITTLAKHQEETSNGGGWTDASDEVAKEIATIWESNFGTDWREILCEENRTRY